MLSDSISATISELEEEGLGLSYVRDIANTWVRACRTWTEMEREWYIYRVIMSELSELLYLQYGLDNPQLEHDVPALKRAQQKCHGLYCIVMPSSMYRAMAISDRIQY